MKFSERYGYKPVRELIQVESVDEALRNGIWNLLKVYYWDTVRYSTPFLYGGYYLNETGNEPIKALCEILWFDFFKQPLDQLDNDWSKVLKELREYFFNYEWCELYDFIEFISNRYSDVGRNKEFMAACNKLLEKEMSAYRFVDNLVTRVTELKEVEAIEEALESSDQLVSQHMRRALELLSDRSNPDYRNSIKESISAIERLAAKVIGSDKGTLARLSGFKKGYVDF